MAKLNAKQPTSVERFNAIYEKTYDSLYRYLCSNCSSRDTVKDLIQECYIRLWQNIGTVQDDDKVLPLLRTYAINLLINHLKKEAVRKKKQQLLEYADAAIMHATDALESKELNKKYREIIDELPPQRRLVFLMKREQNMSHQQIARELNISTFTIDRHMNEALRTFRKKLVLIKYVLWLAVITASSILTIF